MLVESMFSLEDSHAKTSPLLEAVLDWLESGADFSSSSFASLLSLRRLRSSSKTSLDFCRQMEDEIWEPLSGVWLNSGMGGPTGCSTLNTLEFPNSVAVCSLSEFLEPEQDVLPKFYLSQKACLGHLRRNEKGIPLGLLDAIRRRSSQP